MMNYLLTYLVQAVVGIIDPRSLLYRHHCNYYIEGRTGGVSGTVHDQKKLRITDHRMI